MTKTWHSHSFTTSGLAMVFKTKPVFGFYEVYNQTLLICWVFSRFLNWKWPLEDFGHGAGAVLQAEVGVHSQRSGPAVGGGFFVGNYKCVGGFGATFTLREHQR